MTTITTNTHEFTLILAGDWESLLDELFEAGCDDATFGETDGIPHAHFDRDADSFEDALATAIAAVESTGLVVERVEPDDLVTTAEIAQRLGRSQQSIHQLVTGARGAGDFPAPALRASAPGVKGQARLWHWVDVLVWAKGDPVLLAMAMTIAAANAALELRHRAGALTPEARRLIAALSTPPTNAERGLPDLMAALEESLAKLKDRDPDDAEALKVTVAELAEGLARVKHRA